MRKQSVAELTDAIRAGWKWDKIVDEVIRNQEEDDQDPSQNLGTCYLGTIFTLTPSGKMYTPFANSNVDRCNSCNGSGHVTRVSKRVLARRQKMHARYVTKHNLWLCRMKNPTMEDVRRGNYKKCLRSANLCFTTCCACDGMGSVEALNDQNFWEALERVADDYKLFIHHVDENVYAAKVFEKEDADD